MLSTTSSSSSSKVPTMIAIIGGIIMVLLPIVLGTAAAYYSFDTTTQFQLSPNWQFLRIAELLLRPFESGGEGGLSSHLHTSAANNNNNNLQPNNPPNNHQQRQNEIFVISAGLPRSGTDSLREALEYLGYHTYHAKQLQKEKHLQWTDLFESTYLDNVTESQYDIIIDMLLQSGYNATTDFPTCLIFDKLIEKFPNAKLILSIRDTPEIWAKSFQKTVGTIHGLLRQPPYKYYIPKKTGHFIEFFDKALWDIIEYNDDDHGDHLPTIESLSRAYVKWLDHVRRTAKTLNTTVLEYNVKQGWEPLCTYLGLIDDDDKCHPIYERKPFPHVNDSNEWILILGIVRFVSNYWIQLLIGIVTICITVLLKLVSWMMDVFFFSSSSRRPRRRNLMGG